MALQKCQPLAHKLNFCNISTTPNKMKFEVEGFPLQIDTKNSRVWTFLVFIRMQNDSESFDRPAFSRANITFQQIPWYLHWPRLCENCATLRFIEFFRRFCQFHYTSASLQWHFKKTLVFTFKPSVLDLICCVGDWNESPTLKSTITSLINKGEKADCLRSISKLKYIWIIVERSASRNAYSKTDSINHKLTAKAFREAFSLTLLR